MASGRNYLTELVALYRKVARKVLAETLGVKKGEAVTVEAWTNGLDFAKTAVAEARSMGCTTMLLLEDEEAYVESLTRSPSETIGKMGKNEYGMLSGTDVYVFIPGPLLGAYQTKVKPQLVNDSTEYNESWYKAAEKAKLRGARLTFGYVGEDLARILGKTVKQVVEFQLNAALVDFGKLSKTAERVKALCVEGGEGILRASGSRLDFVLEGGTSVEDGIASRADVEAGENMTYVPPGCVSCSVGKSSASGIVAVSQTVTRRGLLHDAVLSFEEGKLTKWRSQRSKELLEELVRAVPEERRRITILNVGVNPKMRYLFGQDRMVAGSVTLGGFGFNAVVREANLSFGGKQAVKAGKL